MDLEEWELLPGDGFLDLEEKSAKKINLETPSSYRRIVFDKNYFVCPNSNPRKTLEQSDQDVRDVKEITKFPIDVATVRPAKNANPDFGSFDADQDIASRVFFKKLKENQFVDMKMDSPPIENINFESKRRDESENSGALNIWKRSLNGFGAILSFGVAAASFCIIILRNDQRTKQQEQFQKLCFKIHAKEKGIREVTKAQVSVGGNYNGL